MIEIFTRLEHKFRPILQSLLPNSLFTYLYSLSRNFYLSRLAKYVKGVKAIEAPEFSQKLFKSRLEFRNDLGNASGFDKDGTLIEFNYKLGAGFAIVGTVLSEPYQGNLQSIVFSKVNPWVPLSNSKSALNSLGLPNKGIDNALENIKKFRKKYAVNNFPIGLSLMAHPKHEEQKQQDGLLESIKKANSLVDFIELNESCPNCNHNEDNEIMLKRIKAIIEVRDSLENYVPILVKLRDLGDAEYTLKTFNDLKLDGLVLTNTQISYQEFENKLSEKDKKLYKYYTQKFQGGVSGIAIKDFSFQQIELASKIIAENNYQLKIVHSGGIFDNQDMTVSRNFNPEIICLRQWYTGFMDALSDKAWNSVYPEMFK